MSSQTTHKKFFYGWIIVIVSIFMTLILAGARFSFGVYFNPITEEFNLTRTTTSSIQSVYMILCILFAMAGGWALDKYGPRVVFFMMGLFTGLSFMLTSLVGSLFHIYLSYSLLFAIGTAPFFPVISATISKWFDKKRGIALGLATSGSRSGQAAFAPLSVLLISSFGWRYAYLITGFITWLVVLPLSRLMKNDPRDIGELPDGYEAKTATLKSANKLDSPGLKGLTFTQAIRKRNYWFLAPTYLFAGFANLMVITHIIPYATDMNISSMSASTILTIIGVVAIPSGILIGRLIDVAGAKILLILSSFLVAGAIVSLIWAQELWHFYLIAAVFGVGNPGIGLAVIALTVDTFGKRNMGTIIASLDGCHSIGSAVGPLVGGLVYDIYGNYDLAFQFSAIGLIISGLLFIFFKPEPVSHD
ncbi:MAG: MFS transporter [Dehalococcoidales bacterium]|nr:MFS transporter [Dehalococcoidales bacterium]